MKTVHYIYALRINSHRAFLHAFLFRTLSTIIVLLEAWLQELERQQRSKLEKFKRELDFEETQKVISRVERRLSMLNPADMYATAVIRVYLRLCLTNNTNRMPPSGSPNRSVSSPRLGTSPTMKRQQTASATPPVRQNYASGSAQLLTPNSPQRVAPNTPANMPQNDKMQRTPSAPILMPVPKNYIPNGNPPSSNKPANVSNKEQQNPPASGWLDSVIGWLIGDTPGQVRVDVVGFWSKKQELMTVFTCRITL